MSQTKIVSAEEFDISKVTFTEPKKKNDRLQCLILYDGSPFYIEFEWGRAPFGVRSYDAGESSAKNYSVNISLDKNSQSVENISQLDEKFIDDIGVAHSTAIFKKKYNSSQREVVRAMFTPTLKTSEDGDYPPRIAPKIQRKTSDNTVPALMFYHSEEEEVDVQSFEQLEGLIPKGSKLKALISLRPWFISGRFGISLTVQQLLVPKISSGRPTTYAFNDRTGAVSVKVSGSAAVAAVKKAEAEAKADEESEEEEAEDDDGTDVESVEDSDNVAAVEEEEEEEEEPEPEPVKKVVKKAAAPKKRVASRK